MKKIFLLLFAASTAHAVCSGYTYQRELSISSGNITNVNGGIANFDVLVTSNNVIYSTKTIGGELSTGFDLTYSSDSACAFMLNWDTETVNTTGTQTRNEWVKIPAMSTASATAAVFYQNWGNASITSYIGYSTGAWDSNFVGVYHLPNGSTLTAQDSTANTNNGTLINAPTATTGQVDGAGKFVMASSQYVDLGNNASLGITGAITISAWVNLASIPATSYIIVGKDSNTGGRAYTFDISAPGTVARFYVNGGTDLAVSPEDLSLSTWYYFVGTFTPTVNTQVYINGSLSVTGTGPDSSISTATDDAKIGARGYAGAQGYMDGAIDEVRISNSIRSSDWITAEYNTVNSSNTFVTYGPIQTATVKPANAIWFGQEL